MLGSITFFTGPMACGKTLELVRQLQIYSEQRVPTICIRPATDTRSENIRSRSGLTFDGVTIPGNNITLFEASIANYKVVGIDEAQFFTPKIVPVLAKAMRDGKTALVSGLDTDFRGEIFPTAHALISLPETVVLRTRAVCAVCLEHNATRTQRLNQGKPARRDEPIIAVDGEEKEITYEPRCALHHIVL